MFVVRLFGFQLDVIIIMFLYAVFLMSYCPFVLQSNLLVVLLLCLMIELLRV